MFFQPSHILTWIWWIFQQFLQVFLLNLHLFSGWLHLLPPQQCSADLTPRQFRFRSGTGTLGTWLWWRNLEMDSGGGWPRGCYLGHTRCLGIDHDSDDGWWKMDVFFFVCVCGGGVDGEDAGWGWWGWRFPMPFRSWPEEMKKTPKTIGIHQSEAAMSLLEDFCFFQTGCA